MTKATIESILGPRIPDAELRAHRARYVLPSAFLATAVLLLLTSLFLPFWRMTLHAPQYPKGLTVRAYLNRLEGDVAEIDGLNHYIGMRKLDEAAKLERELSVMAVIAVSLLVLGAIFIHNRRAALLALPAALFPAGFLIDLHLWLAHFGHNLDPRAPLSSSIKPFTPPVLGVGVVGQFRTVAVPDLGLSLAFAASAVILAGLYLHRRAYKPLVERAGHLAKTAIVPAVVWVAATGAFAEATFDLRTALRVAPPGSTVHVPAGVHAGPFVVDKAIVLEGAPGAVLQGSGDGDVLRIVGAGAVVRGLAVRGTGVSLDRENAAILVEAHDVVIERNVVDDALFGIYARKADRIVVRGNTIHGKDFDVTRRGDSIRLWSTRGGTIDGNVIRRTRDVVVWFCDGSRIVRNDVRDSRYGLHLMYAKGTVIEDNRLDGNSVGAFLMYSDDSSFRRNIAVGNRGPSGYGLGLKDNDGLVAEDNQIIGNRVGIYVDNSPNRLDSRGTIRENLLGYNDVGIGFLPSVRRNDVSLNAFVDNLEHVAVFGPGTFAGNEFTVGDRGNYWSDYQGYDLDGDGLGDLPYTSQSLFENLMDRHPQLRLFQFSPVQQAVDLAVRAFPVVRPRPKLTDSAPLTSLPRPLAVDDSPRSRAPFAAMSAGLLLGFGSVAAWAGSDRRLRRIPITRPARRAALAAVGAAPMRSMISVSGLRKTYGTFAAVDGVSIEVAAGEAVALWGPNGAGKSTVLKCLVGLLRHAGTIRVDDRDVVSNAKAARARLGYVAQELAFHPEWSGRELLVFFAKIKRVAPERVEVALAEVGLAAHGAKAIASLSGGMKQRLALAAALLADPPVLVLDEITSNLDAAGREGLLRVLCGLKQAGKTILFTSHRRDDILRLADRVIVLDRGSVVREGGPDIAPDPESEELEELA